MQELLSKISQTENCLIKPCGGIPKISHLHSLPNDVIDFYSLCGGLTFFVESDYAIDIVAPSKVLLSNPVILPNSSCNDINADDISNAWYIIPQSGNEQYITIDFNSKRLGLCYDSFWDIHASPGDSPIIARSFTELITKIYHSKGEYWFWLAESFSSLGDAYD